MLIVDNLQKNYRDGKAHTIRALTVGHLEIESGSQLALIGPSGSGKSTLLHCIAGLITPTAGTITWNGERIDQWSETQRARWRSENVGYIFQQFNLLESLTVLDNVLAGCCFARQKIDRHRKEQAACLLGQLGLEACAHKKPKELSMGEQQRVAIARALLKQPGILLADEPTASLDSQNSETILRLLREYSKKAGCICMVASHDPLVQAAYPVHYHLAKGGPLHETAHCLA